MKRRKFTTTAAVSAIGATSLAGAIDPSSTDEGPLDNEIYELRNYEISFGDNKQSLMAYLSGILLPSMRKAGANHTIIFKEKGDAEPTQLWVMISYPSLQIYHQAQKALTTSSFVAASADHAADGKSYSRYTTSLLSAFDGIPQMRPPTPAYDLFELRIYEGVNDDAVRRKVKMFNDEELPVFDEVGLNSIFFGKMLVGPYMPNLVYMLGFKDMEDRDTAWQRFLAHPDWIAMLKKPIYKDTVSNIRKIFLEKIGS